MQYKRKHRLSAALMAGAMCCTMIPAASADEIATPETAEAAAAEATNQVEQPAASDGGLSVEEIQSRMYPSLPQTATGYYLDSNGLPVLTGETKSASRVGAMRITVTTMPTARFKSHLMRDCSIPTAPQPLFPAWTVRTTPSSPSVCRCCILPTAAVRTSHCPTM